MFLLDHKVWDNDAIGSSSESWALFVQGPWRFDEGRVSYWVSQEVIRSPRWVDRRKRYWVEETILDSRKAICAWNPCITIAISRYPISIFQLDSTKVSNFFLSCLCLCWTILCSWEVRSELCTWENIFVSLSFCRSSCCPSISMSFNTKLTKDLCLVLQGCLQKLGFAIWENKCVYVNKQ